MKLKTCFGIIAACLISFSAMAMNGDEGEKGDYALKGNSLLWKVTADNGATSHLFGTLHILRSGYLENWPKVQEAYQTSEKVIVETIIDSSKMQQLRRMAVLQGKTLSNFYDSTEYQMLTSYIEENLNFPMMMLERMKPMQVMLMLTMQDYKGIQSPMQSADGLPVDQYFAVNGKKTGKKVIPLEKFLEQGRLLFNEMSNEKQAEALLSYVEMADEMEKSPKKLIKAYQKRNLKKLYKLYQKHDKTFKNMAFLVDDRNKDWMKTASETFQEGNAFMAVGALHLPGEQGVIQLLRNKGFKVEPVKVK